MAKMYQGLKPSTMVGSLGCLLPCTRALFATLLCRWILKNCHSKFQKSFTMFHLHSTVSTVSTVCITRNSETAPFFTIKARQIRNRSATSMAPPGKLRDYHGPIFWNYGMLPQTWEDGMVRGKIRSD